MSTKATVRPAEIQPLSAYLKWAGGKRSLIPRLQPLYNEHRDRPLYEPFCGALNVALGLRPKHAFLNDINADLINLHTQVQRGLSNSIPMAYNPEEYYRFRDWFNGLQGNFRQGPIAAQIFYYLNRTGFNGLCRYNQNGQFNVPIGRYKTVTFLADFWAYQEPMRHWQFSCGDFEQSHPGAFIYADPPYDDGFTAYSGNSFSWDEQRRLAHYLASHRGPVVASNKATDRIVDLYQSLGFHIEIISMKRAIACNGDRTPAQEILAVKGL